MYDKEKRCTQRSCNLLSESIEIIPEGRFHTSDSDHDAEGLNLSQIPTKAKQTVK